MVCDAESLEKKEAGIQARENVIREKRDARIAEEKSRASKSKSRGRSFIMHALMSEFHSLFLSPLF